MNRNSVTRSIILAAAFALALPVAGLAQGRRHDDDNWRWGNKCDKFVNCHDARDGRVDGRGPRRDRRDRDDRYDRRDDRYDRNDRYGRDDRYDRYGRRDDGYYGGYGNNGGYRTNDNYGYYGGSYDLRQTALNAGYNEGIKAGRDDRRRGRSYDYADEGAYRSASKDYNSRLGDRYAYQQYFREAFATGYRDGYRGY